MANFARGEASFTASDGRHVVLVVDFNALAEAECAVDMGANEILAGLQKNRIKPMQGIVYGALKARQPDTTMDDVNAMLQSSDFEPLLSALGQAVQGAFPQTDEVNGGAENPPPPPTSNGTSSKGSGRKKA